MKRSSRVWKLTRVERARVEGYWRAHVARLEGRGRSRKVELRFPEWIGRCLKCDCYVRPAHVLDEIHTASKGGTKGRCGGRVQLHPEAAALLARVTQEASA